MVPIISTYQDLKDTAAFSENGNMAFSAFNRLAERASLWLIDFLTGKVSGTQIPVQYLVQKNRDYLQHLITDKPGVIGADGKMQKPDDYYTLEHFYRIGHEDDTVDCEGGRTVTGKNTPITVFESKQYDAAINTSIPSCLPDENAPVAKIKGDFFYVFPKRLGQVNLEYIRYAKTPKLATKINVVTNNEEIDPANCVDFEWPEALRDIILWFMTTGHSIQTRERGVEQSMMNEGKKLAVV